MRTDHRKKPFYARIRLSEERFVDSTHYATAAEAAAAFDRMIKAFRPLRAGPGGIR
jgi:hypothetical protein